MREQRPNPDELLARVQATAIRQSRGKLKIFFGATAGVGKTYAMLEAARERQAEGIDVVVGYAETHGRKETEMLLVGLEIIPRRPVAYRGTTLYEFDIDAALARHPELILIDELAHTNAPGSRHAKRWQDVTDLLDAGITVYTTLNVQHLESLNDIVAQITGVLVRETLPDSILEQADEVEIIDLSPEDLLQRLREGKVYVPQQAEQAARNFFRKGNLIALRELALRHIADRVDAQMEDYRRDHAIREPWPATMRILVGISSGPTAARLVRAARRMATALRASWIVAYVETPNTLRRSEAERDQLIQTLRLAEQLGAETLTLSGSNAADTLLAYARERNISKIVIGKPEQPRWRDLLFGSVADNLIRRSGVIDISILSGDFGDTETRLHTVLTPSSSWQGYLWAPAIVLASTGLTLLIDQGDLGEANLIMIYLLGVLAVALRGGRGPSVMATVLSVIAFNFFFVEPRYSFAVSDTRYLITFAVMLLVGLVVSTLMVRFRWQANAARTRERRTAALYALSRELANTRELVSLLYVAVQHIHAIFDSQVVVLLPVGDGRIQPWGMISGWARLVATQQVFAPNPSEQAVAQWVFDHHTLAGLGTHTLPSSEAVYLPLLGAQRTVGVLGVRPDDARRLRAPEQLHLLETFANQIALAIERAQLADEAQQAQIQIATERLRNSLLSSVSHDLRTPLATITGAASSLLTAAPTLEPNARHELAQAIYSEAERLSRLVSNLLEMTRLEAGIIQLQKEWQPIEELVGAALNRLDAQLNQRALSTQLAPDLPLIAIDGVLIEQVLINLIENVIKHTPAGSPIEISAIAHADGVLISIADRGPGLPPGDEQRIFEKFYRSPSVGMSRGVGLGLTICKGIVEAHGGRIWAENRPGGGTVVRFSLPVGGVPPQIEADW